MPKKTFNEKLNDSKKFPEVVELTDPRSIERFRGTRMLIAPPLAYDRLMRQVPEGKVVTSDLIRDYLAGAHGADFTCPLTAGIFMNIVAGASVERGTDETPYWRTLKKDGELNEKYPGGIEDQKALLEAEGHTVIQKGKRYFVKDYSQKLYELKSDTAQ